MEQWKDVVGYEGRYQVSNDGNVRSLRGSQVVECRAKKVSVYGGRRVVYLNKGGRGTRVQIAYLVSQAFDGAGKDSREEPRAVSAAPCYPPDRPHEAAKAIVLALGGIGRTLDLTRVDEALYCYSRIKEVLSVTYGGK